jgi:hypothetical protein
MKKKVVILFFLLIVCSSFTNAYSFEDLFEDTKNFFLSFSSITGMVVAELGEEDTQEERF